MDNNAPMPPNEWKEDDSLINLYAELSPNGFFIRTLDENKLVVSHDGEVMRLYDPAGEVVYTLDVPAADSDIDLVMDTAWGRDISTELHTMLESVNMLLGQLVGELGDGEF